MNCRARVVVSGGVLGAALLASPGVASAQVGPALTVDVRLGAGAPTSGELVSGLRTVDGFARAAEGVRRVDLYVVPSHLDRDVSRWVPVDSEVSAVPLAKADFTLQWDSAQTSAPLVDLVVIARTATRTGRVEIRDVQVGRVVPVARSTGATAQRAAPARRGSATAGSTTLIGAASEQRSAARLATEDPAEIDAEVGAAQAAAFDSGFGPLPYAADATSANLARPRLGEAGAQSTRSPWPYAAAGLVLLVTAGHVQRAARASAGGI